MASATRYVLHVLRAHRLACESQLRGSEPRLYVTVKLDGTKKVTPIIEGDLTPEWNASLTFSTPDTACMLKIQVKHRSTWPFDPCIGYVEIELGKLLRDCESGEAVLDLLAPHKKPSRSRATAGTICLELKTVDLLSSVETDVTTLQQTVDSSGIGNAGDSTTLSRIDDASRLTDGNDLYKFIGGLLSKLNTIAKFIDDVSEVNPYLKVAWNLISLVYKSVANVFQVDKKAVDLARALDETFDFVSETHTLRNKTRILEPHIIKLLKTTCDCCEFLQKYVQHGFVGRMLSLDASATIDGFMQSVREQKNDLNLGLAIHNAAITARTSEKIDELFLQHRLSIHNAVPAARQPCLKDTRVQERRDIIDLLKSETGPNIVWLHGVAGSGKSTIATSIEDYFRDVSQLGAFLKFERGKSDPISVVCELAFKLALFDSSIGCRITQQVEQDKDIASALLSRQFEKLLLQPLSDAVTSTLPNTRKPVVIILDALDECGTPETRADLMSLLENELPKLPDKYHFLITSRAEPDIANAFSELVREIPLDYTSYTSRRDVLAYLHHEMLKVTTRSRLKLPNDWPWDTNMAVLGEAAGGLFIWASIAVKIVAMSDNPFRKLNNLVSDSRLPSKHGLDELYATVLRCSGISWDDDDSKARVSAVLALLLFSKIPLSNEAIDAFLGFPPEESSDLILSRLRCLLSYTPGEPVRIFHVSFSDYLQSPDRDNEPWFIDLPSQKAHLAMRCFAVMEGSLRFNLGNLDTSFTWNCGVQDLHDRIRANIPLHLGYACAYWASHLVEVATSSCLLNALSAFANHRLLFWFEALSLLRIFRHTVSRALPDAASWAICNTRISSFLKDASSLATVFADPISQSTPHIYVSMLPLTREDSKVSAHYSQCMSSMVRVEQRGVKPKPMWLKVLEGHSEEVSTVCFSPDGRRIVSGSEDGTVRMWSTDSGELVCAPLKGHTGGVGFVAFSTDGQYLSSVSNSGTILTWDMQDGAFISCLLVDDTVNVSPKAFSSDSRYLVIASLNDELRLWDAKSRSTIRLPEGLRNYFATAAVSLTAGLVATGAMDGTVRLCDMENGSVALELLPGDADCVGCMAFSPDGARIAVVYDRITITIRNVASGEVVSVPFVGHTDYVSCVAFSPDGRRIVSGSEDNTIRVWDVEKGEVAGPFIGHSSSVRSVAFSPDGSHIVSGSDDRTVRVWDVSTASKPIAPSSEITDRRVRIFAFSPDDSNIVSVSENGTIRVWDIAGDPCLSRCFEGDDTIILSLAFTLDGSYIVSGSKDGTIRVWNFSTGAVVSGPYKAHTSRVEAISTSPDGTLIVSASKDKILHMWHWTAEAADVVASPSLGDASCIICAAFTPDASRIVYGTSSGRLMLCDTRSGDVILEPFQGHRTVVTSVAFSPDARFFASCHHHIRVWNATTGDLVSTPFQGESLSIVFSPDGSKLVFGSRDRIVRMWDLMTEKLIADALIGHRDHIQSVAFSHDGRHVASGSDDGTIRLWDVEDIASTYGSPDEEDMAKWEMTSDGWIVSRKEQLLLWVPPDRRRDLLYPHTASMFGCAFWTKMDFRNASIGSRWRDCYKPT